MIKEKGFLKKEALIFNIKILIFFNLGIDFLKYI